MAGAFSGHLLNSFTANPPTSSIVTSGAMTFDARQHGSLFSFSNTPFQPLSFSGFGASPLPFSATGQSHVNEESAIKIATLQAKLNKKLGPEYVSQRPGPGNGPRLTYAEGWKIINLANEVFGFNGWSSSIVNLTTDFVDCHEEERRFNVGVTAIVRVTLRDGAYHEDVGYGLLENARSKAAALDKCKKEAITDALKRTLRNFGNLLGNCLYDKAYAQEVVKIKVPPAKFDKSELYRRPEFEEIKPTIPPPAAHRGVPESTERSEGPAIKKEVPAELPETPIAYIPRHLRQEMAAAAQQTTPTRMHAQGPNTSPSSVAGPSERKPLVVDPHAQKPPMGLHTPIQTPPQRPQHQSRTANDPFQSHNQPSARKVSSSDMPPLCNPNPNSNPGTSAGGNASTGTRGDAGPPAPPTAAAPIPDEDTEDAYPLSTQDGAFFATVDLGEGDLGRPIDFEEGMGGEIVSEDSMADEAQAEVSKAIQRTPSTSSVSAGISAGRSVSAMAAPPNPGVRPSGDVGGQADNVSGSTSTLASGSASTLTPGTRMGPTSNEAKRPPNPPMGGFHFTPGMKPPTPAHYQPPKPVRPVVAKAVVNPANGNALKRSADVMEASSSAAVRTPIQGMGLAQRQHPHPHPPQNAVRHHLLDTTEGGDIKRIKR